MQIFIRFANIKCKYKSILKNSQQHIFTIAAVAIILSCAFFSVSPLKADNKGLGLRTVCIDAGHGGKDPGCVSRDGSGTKEKDIVLSIAKDLSRRIKTGYPDVKVVMTRSNDTFVELGERAGIANRNNADLFISIHVNSVDTRKNRSWAAANGFSIHTLGQSKTGRDLFSFNMEVCKRENSVILLEDDYTTKYHGFDPAEPESYIFFNLMQNANLGHSLAFAEDVDLQMAKGPISNNRGLSQDPFYVLWKTKMPAVLIEVGFITNTSDLAVMKTEIGRKAIANRIYQAFVSFKKRYDASMNINPSEPVADFDDEAYSGTETEAVVNSETEPDASNIGQAERSILYGTQIFASAKLLDSSDSRFMGYVPTIIQGEKVYKYIIGVSEKLDEAKNLNKKIKKSYPDSFIVSICDNSTKRIK